MRRLRDLFRSPFRLAAPKAPPPEIPKGGTGKLVSIFGCGVQKAGTTSLYAHMSEHPRLSAPRQKEIHFFNDETVDWTSPDYTRLEALFPGNDGDRLRFEVTPIYLFWPPSIARLAAYNPDAKLILLFRDPFERAWSHWCMEFARGNETLPFAEAIRDGRRRLEALAPLAFQRQIITYVERGFYGGQVRRALAHFPREQLLFLRSEDLKDRHVETLRRISDFLGLTPFPPGESKREHARAKASFPAAPTRADRALIAELLHEDLRDFAALTGLDISDWPSVSGNF